MDLSNSQGFVASAPVEAGERRVVKSVGKKLGRNASREELSALAVAENGAIVTRTSADKQIATLHKVQGHAEKLYMMDLLSMTLGGGGAWLMTKFGSLRGRTIFKAIFTAPNEALHNAKKLTQVPSEYMKALSKHAWHSTQLENIKRDVPKEKFTWNPKKAIKNKTDRAKLVEEYVEKQNLSGVSVGTAKGADKVAAIAQNAERRAGTLATSGENLSAAITQQTSKVTTPIKGAVRSGLGKVEGTAFGRGFEKLTSNLPKWKFLEKFKGQKLTGAAETLSHSVGNMSVFGKVIWIGALAGIGAAVLTHKKDGSEAKKAMSGIAADIGDKNPLFLNIQKAYHGQSAKRVLGTTATAGGEILNAALFASHEMGGGPAAMMMSMSLPMIGQTLVANNAALNAYANLKLEDAGKGKLKPEERVEAIRQLLSFQPSVAPYGGYYNRLAGPLAEAIAAKGLSASETMKFLADTPKFTALAQDVTDKQAAAKAAEAPVAETVATAKTHELHVNDTKTLAESAYAAAEKPHQMVGHAASQGKVSVAHQHGVTA